MKKIILITGGQRSGKSSHAEALALSLTERPVYVATAHVWDEEFRQRVLIHQQRRNQLCQTVSNRGVSASQCQTVSNSGVSASQCQTVSNRGWTTIKEEKYLSRHNLSGRVAVIDCVTLWLANWLTAEDSDINEVLAAAKAEFDRFTACDATFIFVTNEIGLGGVSANALQRRFTDLQGWMNQYIAARADEVILMVSGIPVKIKP